MKVAYNCNFFNVAFFSSKDPAIYRKGDNEMTKHKPVHFWRRVFRRLRAYRGWRTVACWWSGCRTSTRKHRRWRWWRYRRPCPRQPTEIWIEQIGVGWKQQSNASKMKGSLPIYAKKWAPLVSSLILKHVSFGIKMLFYQLASNPTKELVQI